MRIALTVLLVVSLCALADTPIFGDQVYVQYEGSNLDVGIYSDPYVVDWDGDGLKDLIVGQYYDQNYDNHGKIRYYPNSGTNSDPIFEAWAYIEADGSDIQTSYG